jgi:hypothetical protein
MYYSVLIKHNINTMRNDTIYFIGIVRRLIYVPSNYFSILILLIVFLIQSCNSTPKTREEQYTEIEKQEITLTYLVNNNKIYSHRTEGAILFGDNPKMKVYCNVTNTSDYGGVFKLYAKLTSQGNEINFQDEQYVGAGSTVEFSEEKEINPFSFQTNVEFGDWGIIAPTKSINVTVIKYRTVRIE